MNKRKFSYTLVDGFMKDGEKIGTWEVLLYLNKMNNLLEEVKLEVDVIDSNFKNLIEKIDEVI